MINYNTENFIYNCLEKVLADHRINNDDAFQLINVNSNKLNILSHCANKITRKFHGNKIDVEQLANIKKNQCSEDCVFCGQSAFFNTDIDKYDLLSENKIINEAKNALSNGAKSYCLVAAWREPSDDNFEKICKIISRINDEIKIDIECSLGFLTNTQAKKLKELGVKRYNHNLETARSKFCDICTTHTYDDRLNTLHIARNAGLELCTGGILGLGETRDQRLELLLELSKIDPEEVTINLLVPIPGTPLEFQKQLSAHEILRVFAVTRFLLPKSIIKISGGREINLNDDGEKLLISGANGIISSGYLTISGNDAKHDINMIKKLGFET